MQSLAITDHGNMYGVIDFYQFARDNGIKPIIGCEMYLAAADHRRKDPSDKSNFHLTVLAKNNTGYKNLIQLVTRASLEGFYYKPRIDRQLLQQYGEGLIILSGCAQGELGQLILQNRLADAEKAALWYKENFEHYFIEIQRHPIPDVEKINEGLIILARKLDIPLVATNDIHYVNKEDAYIHDVVLCIGTKSTIQDKNRLKMAGDYFYLKSPAEMEKQYEDLPDSLQNTAVIADMCNVEIEFGKPHLPKVDVPPGKTAQSYLAVLCWRGLKERLPDADSEAQKRLAYELEVIEKTQFADYFLVVSDLVSFVRQKGIYYGVRGSAAASLVLYCLGITDINPLTYNLVFERFLNIERHEMPDIDLDFQDDRREEVIAYVNQKYGMDHVAQIITFGTLGARAAIKDVGRALGMNYGTVDQIARLIPPRPNIRLEEAMLEVKELQELYAADESLRKLIDTAKKLEGISRHFSTHAAGVVISRDPLTQYLPLQHVSKDSSQNTTMTQFSMDNVAKLGLLKMDFLGLANLTLLAKAQESILQNRGIKLDLLNIPLDDKQTFDLLASGETAGIFQLESSGMRRYIRELKPTKFTDIAAMVALYRPGPMEQIPTFIRAKHGIEEVRYPHQDLIPILAETYGVIVYQDQVLLIVRQFAGYSLGRADIIRKAMGKKIPEVMKKEKINFIEGAKTRGYPEDEANAVFALIEPFAGYAFNKAHSVSYARIAYETAFLKANYPLEYMTAFLNTYYDKTDRLVTAVVECRRMGIDVLQPDINRSSTSFTIENSKGKNSIRYGLAAIKNIGVKAIEPILSARNKGGEFKSIEDFCHRVDLRAVSKKAMESLIKAGAFDCLGQRGALLAALDEIVAFSLREQKQKETGQASMFDLLAKTNEAPLPALNLQSYEVQLQQKLEWEKELIGVYFSEHPLTAIAPKLSELATILCGEITTELAGEKVTVAGMVSSVRHATTKNSHAFVIVNFEDLNSNIEITVWSDVYAQSRDLWTEDNILIVDGIVKVREDRVSLNCIKARRFESSQLNGNEPKIGNTQCKSSDNSNENNGKDSNNSQAPTPKTLVINITQSEDSERDLEYLAKVMEVLRRYPGKDAVQLSIRQDDKVTRLDIPDIRVEYCKDLIKELAVIQCQ